MKGVYIVPKDAIRNASPPIKPSPSLFGDGNLKGRGDVSRWGGYYIIIRTDGKGG
jgi:hypothetical protein